MAFKKFHFHTEVFIDFVENVDVIGLCSEENDFYHADRGVKEVNDDMNDNSSFAVSVYTGSMKGVSVSCPAVSGIRVLFGNEKGHAVPHQVGPILS